MAFNYLFQGMEAYLDDDVEINNNVTTPEDDAVAAADQSAEIASDVADANSEAKDSEIQAQMLVQMSKLYTHVKQFGIDRTFVALYNDHGALDQVCNIRFPSCESMPAEGSPSSKYSQAFIAAMEDEKIGLWTKIKNFILGIWDWIVEKAVNLKNRLTKFCMLKIADIEATASKIQKEYTATHPIDVSRMRTCQILSNTELLESINEVCDGLTESTNAADKAAGAVYNLAKNAFNNNNQSISENDQNIKNCKADLSEKYKQLADEIDRVNAATGNGTKTELKDKISEMNLDTLLQNAINFGKSIKTAMKDTDDIYNQTVTNASNARKLIKDVRGVNSISAVFATSLVEAMKTCRLCIIADFTRYRYYSNLTNGINNELHMPLFLKQLQKK